METVDWIYIGVFFIMPALIAAIVTCAINERYIWRAKKAAEWASRVRLAGRLQAYRVIKEKAES